MLAVVGFGLLVGARVESRSVEAKRHEAKKERKTVIGPKFT